MKRLRLWFVAISVFLVGAEVGMAWAGRPLIGWPAGLIWVFAWFAVAVAWRTRKT
jgi:hypothetical protein